MNKKQIGLTVAASIALICLGVNFSDDSVPNKDYEARAAAAPGQFIVGIVVVGAIYAGLFFVFKTPKELEASDLEPKPASATAPSGSRIKVGESQQASPGDLYTQLLNLEDLHKKGILTDEEFQGEKKKLLSQPR